MIRFVMDAVRLRAGRLLCSLKKKRVFCIASTSGRAALYDPETDVVALGDGTFARMSDIVRYYHEHYKYDPLAIDTEVYDPSVLLSKLGVSTERDAMIQFFKDHRSP